jgi:trehalose synthase
MSEDVIPPLDPARLDAYLSDAQRAELEQSRAHIREVLDARSLFHLSSSMRTGGLAELLRSQVAYARGMGVDAHWERVEASTEFYALAKRIHNRLHGQPDHGPFGGEIRSFYEHALEEAGRQLRARAKPGDLVVLHDAQTAGLAKSAKLAGAQVIWRCHVGRDVPNDTARGAWDFLLPYVSLADAYVFSRPQFTWEMLDRERSFTIPPVINPIAPKNQELSQPALAGILGVTGIQPDGIASNFVRLDGTPSRVDRRVVMAGGGPLDPAAPVISQVSAWNRLKDPAGVVRMFGEFVAPESPAHLVLAGPAVKWIPAETEAEAVYNETVESLGEFPPAIRERVHIIALPNDDPEEAAAIVNALQRRSDVALQRSRGEGFGLAVMEAMWKRRPVVSTRIGGLQDQVLDGETGFLIEPGDAAAAGQMILTLLGDPELARSMGQAGHQRVAEQFLLPHDIPRWIAVMEFAYSRTPAPQHA